MIVFTEEWLSELEERYGAKPRYMRPEVYFYATENEYNQVRNEIEEWIQPIPESQLPNVVSRLRTDKHFKQTYNELATGSILNSMGCKIIYEKPLIIGKTEKTPDWFASKNDMEFAVEVLTIKTAEQSQNIMKRIGTLLARIREIPYGVVLDIKFDWANPPNQQQLKVIIRELKKWLVSSLQENDVLNVEGLTVKYHKQLDSDKPLLFTNSHAYAGSTHGLGRKIEEKVSKYKGLEIPLVISVVPTFYTQLDVEDAQNVILGTEKWTLFDDNSIRAFREQDGLYSRKIILKEI